MAEYDIGGVYEDRADILAYTPPRTSRDDVTGMFDPIAALTRARQADIPQSSEQKALTEKYGEIVSKQKEVDERVLPTDADVLAIVEKLIKQRKESVAQFQAAQRQDLVTSESFEIEVLQGYLPQRMSEDEVNAVIAAAISEVGAAGPKDMGKVMTVLRGRLAGRADMTSVSAIVKARLSG